MFYLLAFFLTLVLYSFYKKQKGPIFYFFVSIPFICISGFRYGIGNDYLSVYSRNFDKLANNGPFTSDFEIGFDLLSWLLLCIGDNWIVFFCVSLATIYIFFLAFKINSRYVLFSIVLFFIQGIYFDTFNGIRQYICVALFLYAFNYIKNKEFKKYLTCMLIASMFHISGLLTIPFYFLKNIKVKYSTFIPLAVVLFVIKDYCYDIFSFIMEHTPRASQYIERNTLNNYIKFNISGTVCSLFYLSFFFIYRNKFYASDCGRFFLNIAFLGLLFSIFSGTIPLMDRFLYFTKSFYLISVPYLLSLSKKNKNILECIILFFISILNGCGIYFNDWYGINPYISIFD